MLSLDMYVKFQKLLMTGCRDMDKKLQKWPQNGGFSPICDPPGFFFQKSGSLTSCKKFEITNERSLRFLKTDTLTQRQTNGPTRAITKNPLG